MFRDQAAKESGAKADELLKQAHALYQRVYVSHKGYPEVCANAYLGAYEVLKELRETAIAEQTLKDLLSNPKLQNTSACKKAATLAK
jgi:hypothetical protein